MTCVLISILNVEYPRVFNAFTQVQSLQSYHSQHRSRSNTNNRHNWCAKAVEIGRLLKRECARRAYKNKMPTY